MQVDDRTSAAPTALRHLVLLMAALAAFSLYLDRYFLGELLKYSWVTDELGLSKWQIGWAQAAFFWPYALAQVPAGWLADRYGPRRLLTVYVVGWSLFMAATGFVDGFVSLFLARVGLGVMQAGAFPTAANLLSCWIPLSGRANANGILALGGRVGVASAMLCTTGLVGFFNGWRGIMLLYGAIGGIIAALYWWFVRDRPDQHAGVNEAEQSLIDAGRPPVADVGPPADEWQASLRAFRQLIGSASMWLMCLAQFGTNIGWVFVVTWLPTYLKETRSVSDGLGAGMTVLILVAGMAGMLLGGGMCDVASRAWGLRWGRCLPLALSRFVAAGACVAVPYLDSTWAAVAALGLMAFATDIGVPATWAYMQDVGGPYIAAVLGWGNMWGNFGAGVGPVVFERVSVGIDGTYDWNAGLFVCAAAFAVSGIAAFGIDATRPVVTAAGAK
jgi:sugar phosphate permease